MPDFDTALALIPDPSGTNTGWLTPKDRLEAHYYHEFILILPPKVKLNEVKRRSLAAGFRIIQLHETAAPYGFAAKLAPGDRFTIGYITSDFAPTEMHHLTSALMADQEWDENKYAGTLIVREKRVDMLKQKSLELSWDAGKVIPEDPEVKIPMVPIVVGGLVLITAIVIAVKVSR